jgi:hypothetical protein
VRSLLLCTPRITVMEVLAWLVTSYVITANVKDQFAVFGGSGAIVFGLLTWLVLAVLFRGTAARVEERKAAAAR